MVHIHPNVHLGPGAELGDYVLLGVPPRHHASGDLETHIGAGAVIRSHTVIYAGNVIGRNFQSGHGVLIRELNDIGDDVSVGSHTVVEHHVRLGDGVRIHSNAFIPEFSIVEAGAWIGPHVVLTNARYPNRPDTKAQLQGPQVLQGARIGANATLLPGVVIGRYALVGAGAVVLHDVTDGAIVVGNPARVVGRVTDC
ncbi:MAG: DapH/DapD/GlmU-related protein [Candidatus Tectimicrobiota bacterium]